MGTRKALEAIAPPHLAFAEVEPAPQGRDLLRRFPPLPAAALHSGSRVK